MKLMASSFDFCEYLEVYATDNFFYECFFYINRFPEKTDIFAVFLSEVNIFVLGGECWYM